MGGEDRASDTELIARMRAGDADAFRTLFDRHLGVLASRARRLLPTAVRRRVSVDDVVQEARIAAFRGAAEFRGEGPEVLRAWLLRIVELKARMALRHEAGTAKRACGREVTSDRRAATADFAGSGPSPSEAAIAGELCAAVAHALETLPPDYREVLRLTRFQGLSLGEAADRMGRSREAVKKLYGRALVCFADALGRDPEPTR